MRVTCPAKPVKIPRSAVVSSLLFLAGLTLSCDRSEPIAGPEAVAPQFVKKGVDCATEPHPSCPGGGDNSGGNPVTLDLTGDAIGANQPAAIATESGSRLVIGAEPGFADELLFFGAAGSPTIRDLGGCVTDPANLDDISVQALINRLNDAAQGRGLAITIDKKNLGQPSRHHGLNQIWVDEDPPAGTGEQYRSWIVDSFLRDRDDLVTVTEVDTDRFTFTGGSIVIWNLSTNHVLTCPNGGSVTVTVNR